MKAHRCPTIYLLIEEIRKWRKIYKTFQPPYHPKMIDDLLEKTEMNIKNNTENILTVIKRKTSHFGSIYWLSGVNCHITMETHWL